ncbi:MAG: hypothetical protein E7434_08360 [Ruminococcaceae bacterium]|nr:hypothetical protein [Oscillospiraceae bacterium]
MNKKEKFPTAIVCKSCGGHIEMGDLQDVVVCSYCGTAFSSAELLNESDAVRTARIHAQAAKEIEATRMKDAAERAQREEKRSATENFKKSKFSKVLIICAVISAFLSIVELSDGFSVSGMIALIQTVLFLISWLMGRGVIKEKIKSMHTLSAVVAFLLIIPFFMFLGDSQKTTIETKPEQFAWTDIEMREALPEPEKLYGEITQNSKTNLVITLCDVSKTAYTAYKESCIASGYTVDPDDAGRSYSAFDLSGYKIWLLFSEDEEELYISLSAPEEITEFVWPSFGPGSMIPPTKSNIGSIQYDNSENFIVCVGDTTKEDYKEYVVRCEEEGFTADYNKDDEYFRALNASGYELTVRYVGFNQIEISVKAPDVKVESTVEAAPTEESSEMLSTTEEATFTEESTAPIELSGELRPEFKESMDSYEAFFDEYREFMEKYIASNGTDLTLALDYAEYVSKYAQMMDAFEAWENEEMNAAEAAYYLEVQARITEKLIGLVP